VTPARNAKEVGHIISSKTRRIATDNGDVSDVKDGSRLSASRGGRRVLTNEGLMAFQIDSEGGISTLSDDQAKGLGEEVVVLQRSARRVLDVQSAILVRMRTITIPGFDGEDPTVENTLLPTLVLCVEIENPVNSGMKFAMDQVDVVVSMPASSTLPLPTSNSSQAIDVSMRRLGDPSDPPLIEQGTQNNLLYQMVFDCPSGEHGNDEDIMKALIEPHRNVSIKVLGRPVMMRKEKGSIESYTPTKKFLSTWTCTLDLAAQMRMVVLQRVMHNGAGGQRFGGYIPEKKIPQRVVSTSTIAPNTGSNYLANLPLPTSPYSSLPRTPTEVRSASNSLTPLQTSPSQMLSLRRPSMRLASSASAQSDTFVSLHRNEMERLDASSPALPSALVGQSILARARMNRSSTIDTGRAEESRQLLSGRGNDKESKLRNVSERTITPTQRNGFQHHRKTAEWAATALDGVEDEMSRDSLLPLGDRRSTATIQRLLYDPTHEQGILIDVVALVPGEGSEYEGKRQASVEVQVENRSERTRTIVFGWRLPSTRTEASLWNSVLLEDDEVQVGPLQRGDSEIVTLKILFTKSGVHQLPPLAVYETSSGLEKVLQGMQSIVV